MKSWRRHPDVVFFEPISQDERMQWIVNGIGVVVDYAIWRTNLVLSLELVKVTRQSFFQLLKHCPGSHPTWLVDASYATKQIPGMLWRCNRHTCHSYQLSFQETNEHHFLLHKIIYEQLFWPEVCLKGDSNNLNVTLFALHLKRQFLDMLCFCLLLFWS